PPVGALPRARRLREDGLTPGGPRRPPPATARRRSGTEPPPRASEWPSTRAARRRPPVGLRVGRTTLTGTSCDRRRTRRARWTPGPRDHDGDPVSSTTAPHRPSDAARFAARFAAIVDNVERVVHGKRRTAHLA